MKRKSMTLKLPEPLPYDYVDELISSETTFKVRTVDIFVEEDGDYWPMNYFTAIPTDDGRITNTRNQLMAIKMDHFESEEEEEENGYVNWRGGGWRWDADGGFTEEELDEYVNHGSVHMILMRRKREAERNAEVSEDSNPVQEGYGEQGEDDSECVDYFGTRVPVQEPVAVH
jgi:hypothetical protein